MGASRPFRQTGEMWSLEDSKGDWANGPAPGRGPQALDGAGLCGLVAAQVLDHIGDVGDLLLEIALVLLQLAKPVFAAGETTVPAEAWASAEMSMSVHAVHLLSSYLSRKPAIVPCARRRPSTQESRTRRPSAVNS